MRTGSLYVVATPIGNLEDITARALRVLGEVACIAAEDTRRTGQLLRHFGIATPLVSYHEHNERQRVEPLIDRLLAGEDLALVTDAGTPCVSDPGYRIVRAAHDVGVRVVCVPGPSALVGALSVSGLPNARVAFRGFFPRKAGEAQAELRGVAGSGVTTLYFESPNRLAATLNLIAGALPEAEVCVARELTKVHEEVARGPAAELARRFERTPARGECVLAIHDAEATAMAATHEPGALCERVRDLMQREGMSQRDAIQRVAQALGIPRKAVYAAAVKSE